MKKQGSDTTTAKKEQLDFWDWRPEDCPEQEREELGDFSQYMNPPEVE